MLDNKLVDILTQIDDVRNDNYLVAVNQVLGNQDYIKIIKDNPDFSNGTYDVDLRGSYIPNIKFFLRLSDIYSSQEKVDIINYIWTAAVHFDLVGALDEQQYGDNDIDYERLSLRGFIIFVWDFTHDKQQVQQWKDRIIQLVNNEINKHNHYHDLDYGNKDGNDRDDDEEYDETQKLNQHEIISWLQSHLTI